MRTHRSFVAVLLLSGIAVPTALAQETAAVLSKGPANLCQEVVAFLKKPEEKKQEAVTPASQATAVSNPSGKSEGQPSSSSSAVQQTSGLSGPVNADLKAPSGDMRTAQSDSRINLAQANAAAKSPPAPGASAPSPKPDEALVAKIEAASASNDQLVCRAAIRSMRVAGVVMPPPLLALAALNPKFFVAAQP
jgi:hypothetical protein